MKLSEFKEIIKSRVAANIRITVRRLEEIDKKFAKQVLQEAADTDKSHIEILYIKIYGKPVCSMCGNDVKWRGSFNQQLAHSSIHCSSLCAGADETTKSRRADTCTAVYGVSAVQEVSSIRQKFKDTMLKNHGVEYTASSKKLHKKMCDTLEINHGVRSSFHSPEVRAKSKATMLRRYGVEFNMQSRELFERQNLQGFKMRQFELEGKEFRVRGYEQHAIEYLHRQGCKPKHILTTAAEGIPSIPYSRKGKNHIYHPDILVKVKSKWWIVEVKSTYTLGLKHPETFARVKRKALACVEAGYNFRLLMVSRGKTKRVTQILSIHTKTRQQVLRELESLRHNVCA